MIILKILLIILLSLISLLVLICLLKLHIRFLYNEIPVLKLRVLFFTYTVDFSKQSKREEKKAQKKEKKEKKPKQEKPKKENMFYSAYKKGGVSGFLELISKLYNLAVSSLKSLVSHITVDKLTIKLSFAGEDAADTAVGYGKCCAVIFPFAGFVTQNAKCRGFDVEVAPDFEENAQSKVDADIAISCRIFRLLITALKFILGYTKIEAA